MKIGWDVVWVILSLYPFLYSGGGIHFSLAGYHSLFILDLWCLVLCLPVPVGFLCLLLLWSPIAMN